MTKGTRFTLDNGAGMERGRTGSHDGPDDAGGPAETVGLELRNARLRRGEEIAHVSVVLKIRKAYLKALEESAFDQLPGRTYAIGFVRSYADYLGLNSDHIGDRLKRELSGTYDAREGVDPIAESGERAMPPGGLIFGVLLALAAIIGIYYLFSAVSSMSARPVPPVPAGLAAEAGLPGAVPPPGVSPPEPPAPETILAPEPPPAAAPPPPPPPAPAPLPAGRKFGAQNANSRLTLVIHRPARVIVRGAEDMVFINRQLEPGDSYQVPNMAGLRLYASDGGAVELIVNGNPAGFAGMDGVAADGVVLSPQDLLGRSQG